LGGGGDTFVQKHSGGDEATLTLGAAPYRELYSTFVESFSFLLPAEVENNRDEDVDDRKKTEAILRVAQERLKEKIDEIDWEKKQMGKEKVFLARRIVSEMELLR